MKGKIRITLLLLALVTAFSSCEKTDPEISTADRDKFIGSYQCVSTGPGGTRNFNMTITPSNSAPDQVLMENFDLSGSGTYIPANISGSNLSMVTTTIAGEIYEGYGVLSGDRITFNFTLDDGQTVETRTATADKL